MHYFLSINERGKGITSFWKINLMTLLALNSLSSCRRKHDRVITRCFYHWKVQFQQTEKDQLNLSRLGVKRIYVRFFDVDDGLVNGPVHKGETELLWSGKTGFKLIPVVFITNRALLCIKDSSQANDLAQKIYRKIARMIRHRDDFNIFDELQLDCDWTAKTKQNYFCMIHTLRQMGLKVSATLRLWQLKYPDANGIPPANSVMLMAYNLSNPEHQNAGNSILDLSGLKKYLNTPRRYPLPVDVALPLFSWGKLYRDGIFLGLMNNISEINLTLSNRFKQTASHEYLSMQDTVIGTFYIREGDLIQIEEVEPEMLSKAAGVVSDYLLEDSLKVAFYHYDTLLINRYGYELLDKTFDRFH